MTLLQLQEKTPTNSEIDSDQHLSAGSRPESCFPSQRAQRIKRIFTSRLKEAELYQLILLLQDLMVSASLSLQRRTKFVGNLLVEILLFVGIPAHCRPEQRPSLLCLRVLPLGPRSPRSQDRSLSPGVWTAHMWSFPVNLGFLSFDSWVFPPFSAPLLLPRVSPNKRFFSSLTPCVPPALGS